VGTELAAGTNPGSVAVDPSGRFAYVANVTSGDVTTFSIDQTTGALTEVGTEVAAGGSPVAVALDPSGRFLYVAITIAMNVSNVAVFSIDQATGALTPVETEAGSGATGASSIAIVGSTP
jgi:6-phosphogluconolactonase (cycloisomerase 2 family)